MLRITYQAGVLHYIKRLDVYPRPEPRPADTGAEEMEWSRNPVQADEGVDIDGKRGGSGPVGWQAVGWLDHRAKERVCAFLSRRAQELGVDIHLRPANLHERPLDFRPITGSDESPSSENEKSNGRAETLTIRYLTPLFFTHLLVLPSAMHVLRLSSHMEKMLWTSNDELFLRVFEPPPRTKKTVGQRLRRWYIPDVAKRIPAAPVHPLDAQRGTDMGVLVMIVAYYMLERLERLVYRLFRARFVQGEEPWNGWGRGRIDMDADNGDLGSIRREPSK